MILRKPKVKDTWPDTIRLVCVSEEPLTSWAVCDMSRESMSAPLAVDYGWRLDACMDRLQLGCGGNGRTLTIAANAFQAVTRIGLWDRVQDRILCLTGADERAAGCPRVVIEDPPTIIQFRVRATGQRHTVTDPRNWGHGPSAQLRSLWGKIQDLAEFARRYEKMLKFCDLGGCWRLTSGSQGYYGFRLNYMHGEIETSDGGPAEKLVKLASYGGRCECMRLGTVDGPIYQYDVRQMYSAVAATLPVPIRQVDSAPWRDCVADVTVTTDMPLYPMRVPRSKLPEITVYPVGTFRTFLCGPELEIAVARKDIDTVHELHAYVCSPILFDWATRLWDFRLSHEASSKIAKSMALGLYGKFGQRQREWLPEPGVMAPPGVTVGDWYTASLEGGVIRHRVLDGSVMIERLGDYSSAACPAIAAWVTSAGRVRLAELIGVAGWHHVHYVDTDSLWVDEAGHQNLVATKRVNEGLGGLKLVATWLWVDFVGIKHYYTQDHRAVAGVPDDAIDDMGTYRWRSAATWDACMEERIWPDDRLRAMFRRPRPHYRHGLVDDKGKVSPFSC